MGVLRGLLYTAAFIVCTDCVTSEIRNVGSGSTASSSSSAVVFGVRREEGQGVHLLPATWVQGTYKEEEARRRRKRREEEEEEEEELDWALTGTSVENLNNNNTEVLAQVGGEATFTCITNHQSDDVVTWLRRDDDELLTVGQQVYAAEDRFTATHSPQNKAWELWVKDIRQSDAGHYECQLTTHPPLTFFYTLKVTQAEAVVSGPREIHIEEGSELALECHVKGAASPPVYIFWYHNSTMVNYGRQDYLQVQHHNYTSTLGVRKVKLSDAGIYTCHPHLATPANVTVHVVKDKTPAAMQHGRNHVAGGGVSLISFISVVLLGLIMRSGIQSVLLSQHHHQHHHHHQLPLLQHPVL